jgi:hypothetical protein
MGLEDRIVVVARKGVAMSKGNDPTIQPDPTIEPVIYFAPKAKALMWSVFQPLVQECYKTWHAKKDAVLVARAGGPAGEQHIVAFVWAPETRRLCVWCVCADEFDTLPAEVQDIIRAQLAAEGGENFVTDVWPKED